MPQWRSDPPAPGDSYTFRIVRTPADRPLSAIITCTDPVGCNTHFVNHRTIPCEGHDECPHCRDGYAWRWHGYVSCVSTRTFEHAIFEYTAPAHDTFKNYYLAHSTLRACHFIADRPSKRPNGRVRIACRPADESRIRLPDPLDIRKILCHIWNVKNTDANLLYNAIKVSDHLAVDDTGTNGRYRS